MALDAPSLGWEEGALVVLAVWTKSVCSWFTAHMGKIIVMAQTDPDRYNSVFFPRALYLVRLWSPWQPRQTSPKHSPQIKRVTKTEKLRDLAEATVRDSTGREGTCRCTRTKPGFTPSQALGPRLPSTRKHVCVCECACACTCGHACAHVGIY